MGDEGNSVEGIRTRGTDGKLKRPAALTFSRLIDLFPPHFHSAADDVGFALAQHPGGRKKGGSYFISDFRPAPGLEGDGGSQGSHRAVCWDFPSVERRERTAALRHSGCTCGPDNPVASGHIVAGLACQ